MTTEAAGLFEHKRSGRVLVCCYNRTLVPYLRSKIEERYGRISWDAPAEGALTVTHFEGLVRELEKHAGMATGLTFEKKEERAKALCAAFDRLPPDQRQALVFDAVYVDEAQDLLPAELEFLRRLARDEQGKQTLIIFYDNAQNIYGVTQPTWGDLGINIVGRTVFMDTCLRNTEQTLKLAFNVLVGSFAAEGEKVATRQFADVAALKSRKLISEEGEAYGIHFAPRRGPAPEVRIHANRREEAAAVVQEVRRLIEHEQVLPSDILVLYISHKPYAPWLEAGLREALAAAGPAGTARDVRLVDADHHRNKNTLLLEDGVLTASTIASAKGYDAAVVFLLGADLLPTDVEGRALFYVGATRSKMVLKVSGVGGKIGLLPEIVRASEILAGEAKAKAAHLEKAPAAEVAKTGPAKKKVCRACGSERLHAQHGRFGYFYRCIDCTENTPMDKRCAQCGKEGRVRKDGFDFFLECAACATSLVIHRNVPLETL
jgi:superfamily I DNA/RNA helicase